MNCKKGQRAYSCLPGNTWGQLHSPWSLPGSSTCFFWLGDSIVTALVINQMLSSLLLGKLFEPPPVAHRRLRGRQKQFSRSGQEVHTALRSSGWLQWSLAQWPQMQTPEMTTQKQVDALLPTQREEDGNTAATREDVHCIRVTRGCAGVFFLGRGKGIHSHRCLIKEKIQKKHLPQLRGPATWGWGVSARGQMPPAGASHPVFRYCTLGTERPHSQLTTAPFRASPCSGKLTFPCRSFPRNSWATSPLNHRHHSFPTQKCSQGESGEAQQIHIFNAMFGNVACSFLLTACLALDM